MTRLQIAQWCETLSLVTDQRSFVNQSIQIAQDRMYQFHDFPFYLSEGAIETVAIVSTGTVEVTNASKTIEGTGTAFTSAMVGRKFRVENERPFYRIASVTDADTLVLEQNYQGSSDTSASYEIFKDEYRLAPDVDKYKLIRQIENGIPLFSTSPTTFDEVWPTPESTGDPTWELNIGTNLDTYETGTVAASGTTITGSSTAWTSVEGLGRMTKIRIGNNVYTVKSVDSDTSITTYETTITASSGSSYVLTMDNLRIQVFTIPDTSRLLYYRYFRQPAILANDFDLPDVPDSYSYILRYGAVAELLAQKGDVNKVGLYDQKFTEGLNLMKLKIGSFSPDRPHRRKSLDRVDRIRRNNSGLERPAFDIRFSS